jgi:hypothetical protein
MNTEQLQTIQTALDEHTRETGHRYRLGSTQVNHEVLGEHYFYVERRVNSLTQPHVREMFGEWMNFFEVAISPKKIWPKERKDLNTRIEPDAILHLLYTSSVIHERGIIKTWLDVMAELGYAIYAVDIRGQDDHITADIIVSNRTLVYQAAITINTK